MDRKKINGKKINGKKRKGKKRKRICKHTQKGGVAYPYYQLFKRLRDQNSLFTQHGSWADPP